jgi:hypothetical protein
MRLRGRLFGPFGPLVALLVILTAGVVLAASPRIGLGSRDDLTEVQAASCPPVGDDGKVPRRAGDAKVSGIGKNSDFLMSRWHWVDANGRDLTVEKWCINPSPEFEPYFSLRVIQSEKKVEHVAVLPGVPTVPPSPTATPKPVTEPGSSTGHTTTRATPTPTPVPPYGGTC